MKNSTRTVSRRRLLAGTAASIATLGISTGSGVAVTSLDAVLVVMGGELDRLRRRCARLHREVRRLADLADRVCAERGIEAFPPTAGATQHSTPRAEIGYDAAWKRWSDIVSASLDLADRIRRTPAGNVAGLAVKFDALMWASFHHEMALAANEEHLRYLCAFGRELARLA